MRISRFSMTSINMWSIVEQRNEIIFFLHSQIDRSFDMKTREKKNRSREEKEARIQWQINIWIITRREEKHEQLKKSYSTQYHRRPGDDRTMNSKWNEDDVGDAAAVAVVLIDDRTTTEESTHHHHLDPRYWELVNEKNERKWIFLATKQRSKKSREWERKTQKNCSIHRLCEIPWDLRLALGAFFFFFGLYLFFWWFYSLRNEFHRLCGTLDAFQEFQFLEKWKTNFFSHFYLGKLFTICLHNFSLLFSLSALTSLCLHCMISK